MASGPAPPGTFMPGTKVQVGNHRVVVERYLSEGGFAHVYVVRLSQPVDGSDVAVLKRVAVPDKAALANMRTEVETMKRLKGHRHIVTYIDSHASQLKGGGYEVFLLMEFCAGGGLIDFMNTRLQNRLTEPEILKIFTDVAEGVACMHYLKPPLLHRDLKVENVLIALNGSSYTYKLCDFGSAAPPRPAATTAAEGRLIEDDVQRHTTLQYRSPEMIDVYRKQPIDEKSDIWALGVLLYKLCYYTTPFEEVGQMAILNAQFKYPAYPPFSDRLKLLIGSMLRENPQHRPNIYQVLREACHMRGKEVPIRDIYADRSQSEVRRYQQLPPATVEPPKAGALFTPPIQETQIIPEIVPMRRGRPTNPNSAQHSTKPSPSPFRSNDPFAALDGSNQQTGGDELSARFPTLDQFTLMHEKSGKFEFESTVPEAKTAQDDLAQRLTNALADEAFVKPAQVSQSPALGAQGFTNDRNSKPSPDLRAEPTRQQTPLHHPTPQRPVMVSTGTMTSPSPPPKPSDRPPAPSRPTQRFLEPARGARPLSQTFDHHTDISSISHDALQARKSFLRRDSKHASSAEDLARPPSSRPSLEGQRSYLTEFGDQLTRSKSANAKPRPSSAYITSNSDNSFDYEAGRTSFESGLSRRHLDEATHLRPAIPGKDREYDRSNISSDVDFLRAKEEEEQNRKREKRMSGSGSKHVKRSSLSSLTISGKGLLSGRFGEAFRRFESNSSQDRKNDSPSPVNRAPLTPITGSEVTELSDDDRGLDNGLDNRDDISPEMRRELERRRMALEEKRVAQAAAEYRARVAEKGKGGVRVGERARSTSIQNKVQALLRDQQKPPPTKTASGYGRYTDAETALQTRQFEDPFPERPAPTSNAPLARAPPKDVQPVRPPVSSGPFTGRSASKPERPPKPLSLRTGTFQESRVDDNGKRRSSIDRNQPATPSDDWERSFNRRFPSLSGLELVETEIGLPKVPVVRTKEV
ncbi:hypothetical protein VTO42DRAFT_15 [Malbranchea cinnamomea]